jgi:predicted metalloprotease with PDZ domain
MISYRIEPSNLQAHLYHVVLRIPRPEAGQTVSLPVWIPGSYLVREFARHLQHLRARQGTRSVPLQQLDKCTWRAHCSGTAALEIDYQVYAFDTSVRAAYLDADRGFFNGTGVFLRVHGREEEPHRVELRGLPRGWEVATALPAVQTDARGQGRYEAASYDELVDHPVELGRFWRGRFQAQGVAHEFVVAGAAPSFDGERLLRDAQRICETAIGFWHGRRKPPFNRYVFLLNVVDDGYGGLEHRASTALICARRDLPRLGDDSLSDGYVTLLGLISHEYFHTWNVKRLRPSEFARYDYTRENYTQMLWFFEGFTSYYDDLLLRRAGLIDDARYLKLLSRTITNTITLPGRQVHSVAQASFDAWVKYYRPDENTVNATISYYTKGALVALALDLRLRAEGQGTLDEAMRWLWRETGGGPMDEALFARALEAVGARSFRKELQAWVHGTQDLPLDELLRDVAVRWQREAPGWAQRLGVRVNETSGVAVKMVLRGSAAERAGLQAGDEILAANGWRLRKLEDLAVYLPRASAPASLQLLVARDQRVVPLTLELPAGLGAVALATVDAADALAQERRRAWLRGR